MNEIIEADGLAAKAIAVAWEDGKSRLAWKASNKSPQGHRGALPGLAEPRLLIDKFSVRVLQKHLSR